MASDAYAQPYIALAELAGGFIHEIKNHLNTLSLNLQLLAEEFENPETQRERRALDRMTRLHGECRRLADLSNDFLRFARVGDRASAEALVAPGARHHNAYFAAGMPALLDAMVAASRTAPDRTSDVKRIVAEGDMVVLDFGGIMDGYGSDTTRTVHVGEPTDEEHEVFEVVKRAQQAAFEAVAVGVPCEDIDRAARAVIEEAGYGEYFIHRVGHGIGMTTHEPPYMVEGETRPIEAGMCFSIEPGIYLPGRFGVRIEDIVVAADDGAHRLNNTSRELHLVR